MAIIIDIFEVSEEFLALPHRFNLHTFQSDRSRIDISYIEVRFTEDSYRNNPMTVIIEAVGVTAGLDVNHYSDDRHSNH